ncbi:hypothetical protein SAMN04487819_107150 [Actinopolyspora alba]|uniref:Antitoxin FitA-like ribbon-helix-helix domain-containing protein n=1 Tax=Actinopolyspora alba TaxID=673379 RepID=A0A1I1XFZ1_9ACTN|nr:antitoxin [Actinopolyspora alba]SFE06319.1 hypothetical protein SAMN04487819_107150 [Actinopolyspora alba]
MATIQVRDLSERAYEVHRTRARASGQSLQAYLRGVLEEEASRTPKAEVLATMERVLETNTGTGVTVDSIVEDREADRR